MDVYFEDDKNTAKTYIAEDKDIEYEDGATKIFINASGNCKSELPEKTSLDLRALISYCSRKEATTDLMRDIDSKVVKKLEDDEMVVELVTVGDKMDLLYYSGKMEGINSSKVEDVDAIVSELNVSLERACEIIGITKEEYNKIKEKGK